MDIREKYKQACMNAAEGVLAVQADGRKEIILSVTVSNGEPAAAESSDVTTVSVLVQGEKGTGCAFTQSMEEKPAEVISRALENTRYANGEQGIFPEGKTGAIPQQGADLELLSVAEAAKLGSLFEKWALEADPAVVQAEATVSSYRTENWTVNSKGLSRSCVHTWFDITVETVVKKDGGVYNTSWCASCPDTDFMKGKKQDLQSSIRRNMIGMAKPIAIQSGKYRVILSRESLCQMLVCMWQPFSGVRLMHGRSCLTGKNGMKIGSEKLSIADAAYLPGCGYGKTMDYEGSCIANRYLMENGVFVGMLHNLESARYFAEDATGNACRAEGFFSGIPSGNTAAPNLTYIVPGTMTEDNMLEMLGDGIWITQTYDPFHSIEPTSGDFAIPCNGVLVKNGKPVGALNALTITGNLIDLWNNAEAVGDTNMFWRFYTGLYYLGGAEILLSSLQVNM